MTTPSLPKTGALDMKPKELPSVAPRRRRLTRLLPIPAFLVAGVLAAACNSGTPSASSAAGTLISQGLDAESHGQTHQALTDFTEALKKDPANAVGYYDLGVVYQEYLSNPTQAAVEYNKALLVNPNYKPAMYNLATIKASTDPQGAMTLYTQLLKLDPKQANVLFNLGLLQIAQSDPTTQLTGHSNLKQAIALQPSLGSRVPKGITP
jgi:Flp pilus assembly protein TadD